jgi:Alpha galactosidase C-terminal beta sandwich domain
MRTGTSRYECAHVCALAPAELLCACFLFCFRWAPTHADGRCNAQVFAAPLAGGARAVLFFNRGFLGEASRIQLPLIKLGYSDDATVLVRDLFNEATMASATGQLDVTLPVDSAMMLRVTPVGCAQHLEAVSGLQAPLRGGSIRQDMIAGSREQLAHMHIRGSTAATPDCEQLDAWRPWNHGFFGPHTPTLGAE